MRHLSPTFQLRELGVLGRVAIRVPALGLAGCLAGLASCGVTDIPVLWVGDGGPGTTSAAALPPVPGTRAEYCSGSGPPSIVDDTGDAGRVVCPAQLAQAAFRYALCTCDGIVTDHALDTDAFDSTQGPYDPSTAKSGGSVGTNGPLNASGTILIGGSLWASDPGGLTTSSTLQVAGELHAEGEVHSGPSLTIGTDAWLAAGLQTSGDVTIGGTLYVPALAPVDVGGTRTIGPVVNASVQSVQVAPACACTAGQQVDVAGFVETYRAQNRNDDAAIDVAPTALEDVTSSLSLTLQCGRFFFDRVGATAPITVTTQGRVAIFVGGDLSTTSDFTVKVPSGSEVDVFVEGNVTVGGVFAVGEPSNPARARIYVGGTGTVNLQGAAQLAGNLYAPRAEIVLGSAPATLFGSIFAAGLSAGADLKIHYDEAILTPATSSGCSAATSCTICGDCGGQACNSGTCGGCAESSQCCAPLVCRGGACVADVIP
jgi:hypothetical protein